jgi:poly-gamma-glutamate synthesis protein (capsule biosynthesis protein)
MDKLISSVIAFLIALVPTSLISNNISVSNQTTILFTGDIMLGRSVMGEVIDRNDYLYPFRNVQSFLTDADITFGNLENAVIKNCPRQYKGSFSFCTTPEIAKGLQESGVDIVTLANNHSYNFSVEGFEETKQILNGLDIKSVGWGNLEIIEKNGIKFGFLGFDYVTSKVNLDRDMDLIKTSDPKVDILIVSPHWGEEYKAVANSFQTNLAKRMVENGADLIIGHHPHWVQNYEEVDGVPVYYSLGNFIFDQMWSEETKKGLIVKITFSSPNEENRTQIIDREEYKTYIPKIGQPEIIIESPKE